jgi:hypothetical protein
MTQYCKNKNRLRFLFGTSSFIGRLMARLHDMVRSKIIHENSVRVLSELCEILYLQLPEGSKEESLIRGKPLVKNSRSGRIYPLLNLRSRWIS